VMFPSRASWYTAAGGIGYSCGGDRMRHSIGATTGVVCVRDEWRYGCSARVDVNVRCPSSRTRAASRIRREVVRGAGRRCGTPSVVDDVTNAA
jgi:hypothetical protein